MRPGYVFPVLICLATGAALAEGTDAPRLSPLPPGSRTPAAPAPPDLAGYTADAVAAMIPAPAPGRVRLGDAAGSPHLEPLIHDRVAAAFARRQGRDAAEVVVIEAGVYDLPGLAEALGEPAVLARDGSVFTLRRPLVVGPDAALVVRGPGATWLRLDGAAGAFLVNAGDLFVHDSRITSWDEALAGPSPPPPPGERRESFRPFVVAFGGSRTYVAASELAQLGYPAPESYGLTLSGESPGGAADAPPPTGWIVDSRVRGNHYGLYASGALDVAVVRTLFDESVRYGIDPHDQSRRLIVAANVVVGTRDRHGIILSRGVRDSWVVGNVVRGSGGSGIVLDDRSAGNVVAGNRVTHNEGDGIAVYESPDNVIWGNDVTDNGRDGLRVRNSWNVGAYRNRLVDNGGDGIEVYAQRPDRPADPNPAGEPADPYRPLAGASLGDNRIYGNRSSTINVHDASRVDVWGLLGPEPAAPTAAAGDGVGHRDGAPGHRFGGDLKPLTAAVARLLDGGGLRIEAH
ncbi:MAG TPA: NosD domain-containing protein [Geminicoccaceae bacterium]|nr:NosD domain-containing protein [Geminicoccaceae bacterium]